MREEALRMTHVTCREQGSTPLRESRRILYLVPAKTSRFLGSMTPGWTMNLPSGFLMESWRR